MRNKSAKSLKPGGRKYIRTKIFVPVLSLIIILFSYVTFIMENRRYILNLNEKYIEETVLLTAQCLDELLHARQKSLDTLAITLQGWLDEPEVDSEMLKFLQDNSIFDYVEFIDSSGLNHNAYGLNSDSTDRENYLKGINGESGIFIIFHSRITSETLICFYTPLYYEGEIFGVLNGMYREETLLSTIDTELFGEAVDSYLCMKDGTVIACNEEEDEEHVANIFHLFEEDGSYAVSNAVSSDIHNSFEQHAPYSFTYEDSLGTGNASIAAVSYNDWMLLQVFPSSLIKSMERDANQSGKNLTIIITIAFMASIVFLIASNTKREHRIMRHAQKDHMTGALNQAAIRSAVDDLLQNNPDKLYAFYIFDIDDFKQANDTFGHAFGDTVICKFAELINSCVFMENGLLGRIGGDEFAVLLPVPDYEYAEKKASVLNKALDTDCISGDVCWHMSASIGFCFAPEDGSSFHELYRKADAALYMSKHKGKGTNSRWNV